jgi:signal transduction histidine kinase
MSDALPAPVEPPVEGASRSGALALDVRGLLVQGPATYLSGVVLLAGLYYGSARLGYELRFAGPVASVVWLPAGVGIAFLYLGGLRFWPGVLVGDLLANDYSALPDWTALVQTVGNMLEVVVAALLIRRLARGASPLVSVRGVGSMLFAIAVGTIVSATVGLLSLVPTDVVEPDRLLTVWRTWWLGDLSGALVVVPLAIAWRAPLRRRLDARRFAEAACVLAATIGLGELALGSGNRLAYLCFPALMWAALRFREQGATLALAVVAGLAVWHTTHDVGPFVFGSVTRSVLNTQLFIGVAALSSLFLAAIVAEREQIAEGLAASRARLAVAADTERRRLERNLHDGAQQRLSVLAYRMRAAAERAEREPDQAAKLYEDAENELQLAIDELRELAHGIHPPVLTALGLSRAIADIATRSPVAIDLVEMPTSRLDDATEATAYYVVAEAVTNAQKYARCSRIRVRAHLANGRLDVAIADDGVGGAAETGGSGLAGLRDRVEAMGGQFEVASVVGQGTLVAASIPARPA